MVENGGQVIRSSVHQWETWQRLRVPHHSALHRSTPSAGHQRLNSGFRCLKTMITSTRFYFFFLLLLRVQNKSDGDLGAERLGDGPTGTTRVVHTTAVPNPSYCPRKEIIPPVANTMKDVLYCLNRISNIFLLLPLISV